MKLCRYFATAVVWSGLLCAHFALADDHLRPPEKFSPEVALPVLNAHQCGPLPTGRRLEVEDVALQAVCAHPMARQAWAAVGVQEAAVGMARAAYFPTLAAKAGIERSGVNATYDGADISGAQVHGDQRSQSLSSEIRLGWTILDFGRREATLEREHDLLSAAISSRDEALQSILFSAVQAFYSLQEKRAALEAARRYEAIAAYSEDAATAKHRAGVGNLSDELQAKTNHRRALLERVDAEGEVSVASGQLAVSMGLDASYPLDVADEADLTSLPELEGMPVARVIDLAMQRRPMLRAARAKLEAQQASEVVARDEYWPTVSLVGTLSETKTHYGQAGTTDPVTRSHGNMVGVQIEIPIFDGFATRYHAVQARAQQRAQQARLDDLELQVSLEVWRSYSEVQTCEQNSVNSAHLLSDAEQALKVAVGRYKAGVGGFVDLLNAQTELAGAQRTRVHCVARLHSARLQLARSLGELRL